MICYKASPPAVAPQVVLWIIFLLWDNPVHVGKTSSHCVFHSSLSQKGLSLKRGTPIPSTVYSMYSVLKTDRLRTRGSPFLGAGLVLSKSELVKRKLWLSAFTKPVGLKCWVGCFDHLLREANLLCGRFKVFNSELSGHVRDEEPVDIVGSSVA